MSNLIVLIILGYWLFLVCKTIIRHKKPTEVTRSKILNRATECLAKIDTTPALFMVASLYAVIILNFILMFAVGICVFFFVPMNIYLESFIKGAFLATTIYDLGVKTVEGLTLANKVKYAETLEEAIDMLMTLENRYNNKYYRIMYYVWVFIASYCVIHVIYNIFGIC